ncbi:MAG TPA: hypothetical protein VM451_04975 [Candidatus Limnocylindria bacterium]|nr:hypothetical protein [Candidatus Limnocylindria bacterium]
MSRSSPLRRVESPAELATAVREIAERAGAPPTKRALILVGGADFTEPELLATLRGFISNLASACERLGIAVVDGGTDSGVMRLMGEAHAAIGATFPLVGVAPAGALDERSAAGHPIDPAMDHTAVLLTPGERFGTEMEWLFAAADQLGADAPTIVLNGGRLSMEEATLRLERGHTVVAVEGSGRAADALAVDAFTGVRANLRAIPVGVGAEDLERLLEEATRA